MLHDGDDNDELYYYCYYYDRIAVLNFGITTPIVGIPIAKKLQLRLLFNDN